jgi:hypothetical protein
VRVRVPVAPQHEGGIGGRQELLDVHRHVLGLQPDGAAVGRDEVVEVIALLGVEHARTC